MIAVRSLVSSEEDSFSRIIPCPLDGNVLRMFITTGLLASNYLHSIGVPFSLYIDDRHNGQLQVRFHEGAYAHFTTDDARNFAAAQSAIFSSVITSSG